MRGLGTLALALASESILFLLHVFGVVITYWKAGSGIFQIFMVMLTMLSSIRERGELSHSIDNHEEVVTSITVRAGVCGLHLV